MARKTKQDWYEEAVQILIEEGADGLTIDNLTARLGVTKGSFYHHFGNHEGFKQHLLTYFEHIGTLDIAQHVGTLDAPPAKRLKKLLDITLKYPPTIEVAIRTWAQRDTDVRDYQAGVDAQRIAFVKDLWLEMIDDPAEAEERAQHLYTILVGGDHIIPPIDRAVKRRLYDAYLRLYSLP
jgi:AcrR family transcriptional regulator